MATRRILVLDGHPAAPSLSAALTAAYVEGAEAAGHDVRLARLSALDFDMDFERASYGEAKPLEPDLERFLSDLEWCEHFVLACPMWWGGPPAKLKGLFDRALMPGRTFDSRVPAGKMPKPLLKGRTGRAMITSDTPRWFMRFVYGDAMVRQLRAQILGFVGIKPMPVLWCAAASHATAEAAGRWIGEARGMGAAAA